MNILIPVPQSPIGVVDDNGHVIMGREWYRYFGLIGKTLGWDTDGPGNLAFEQIEMHGDGGTKSNIAELERRLNALEMLVAETPREPNGHPSAPVESIITTRRGDDMAKRIAELEVAVLGARRANTDFYSGVSRITGTTNQVIVSAPTGAVALSLPQSIATTSNVQFAKIGLGMVPSNIIDVTQNQNGPSRASILNNDTGVLAVAQWGCFNLSHVALFSLQGTAYTTTGSFKQDGLSVYCDGDGGITVNTGAPQPIYISVNDTETARFTASRFQSSLPIKLKSYTVAGAGALTGAAGDFIYVSDEAGGAVPAFYEGAAWRRVTDRAVIS